MLVEELITENVLTQSDLDAIERFADNLFAKVGIDVEFSSHFIDRMNDIRNKKQITSAELIRLFKQTYKKHGKKIPTLGDKAQAVLHDMATDINVPFVLHWDVKNKEFILMSKTIMRKKNFSTSNQKIEV